MQNISDKIVSIMQPTYLPWMGYFNLIKTSDVFVLYDSVQLTKRSWQVRNRIKTKNGELYLSVPIKKTKDRDNTLISDALIDYTQDWRKKHLESMRVSYGKSKHFEEIFEMIQLHLYGNYETLSELNSQFIIKMTNLLGIDTKILLSNKIEYVGKKDHALISICKSLDIVRYKSVKGAMDYIMNGENLFQTNNIDLIWHEYEHPVYEQINGEFISHMSIIDCLFNVGVEKTREMI